MRALLRRRMGDGKSIVTGGDDGRLVRIGADGAMEEIFRTGGKWIEQVAASPASGALACAAGKEAIVFATPRAASRRFTHPATVMGLAFDPKGKRIAAAHYNGVTLWWIGAENASGAFLEWKGSHTAVLWHPGGEFIVTAMQENMLHGWRLADGKHMRMSGYPAKVTRSFSWSPDGDWLATSGADACVICCRSRRRTGRWDAARANAACARAASRAWPSIPPTWCSRSATRMAGCCWCA